MTWVLAWAARARGAGDVLFAAAVLGAVSLLVAPAPPALIDLGLALSLALSAAVLLAALLAREPLRLSALPATLLLGTLLRLALSVASTRLVLARGEAGRVVQAFGEVLVRGSPVAGAVVFAILTLVQLLVVARGAERAAEVAARFALDALPGKQMSIDADLRNGAVDAAEARRRRRALEREGQLHGAMDGALKFVKGDAIAGVAVVLVNAAGGLCAGLARGMGLEAAARRYLLLAVGDGLASQLPGLLMAVAAGVAVTRVAGEEEGSTLPADLARQLLADPRTLGAAAALCGALALVPGMPAAPFLLLAGVAAAGARLASRGAAAAPARETAPDPDDLPLPPAVALELSPELVALAAADGCFLAEAEPLLRQALWREMGVPVSSVAVRRAPLPPGGWRLMVEEVPAGSGRAELDRALALAPPDDLRLAGIEGLPSAHPLTVVPAAVVESALAPRASALGPVLEPLDRVLAGAAAALCRSAHRLMGVEEAQALLASLEDRAPALAREASRQIPPALLAEVLRRLLEEGVPIRALRVLAQSLLEAGGATRPARELAEGCRRALGRHLAHRLSGGGSLEALLLDPEVEARIQAALAQGGPPLAPAALAELLDRLGAAQREAEGRAVLLTGAGVRRAVRDLVAPRYPGLAVLSYEELPPEWPVRPRARIALAA
jgi:type III secretion protein V